VLLLHRLGLPDQSWQPSGRQDALASHATRLTASLRRAAALPGQRHDFSSHRRLGSVFARRARRGRPFGEVRSGCCRSRLQAPRWTPSESASRRRAVVALRSRPLWPRSVRVETSSCPYLTAFRDGSRGTRARKSARQAPRRVERANTSRTGGKSTPAAGVRSSYMPTAARL